MHGDMARELERNAEFDLESQQEAIDAWRAEFNLERPHEALGMKTPRELYSLSSRPYSREKPEIEYPEGFQSRRVRANGTIRFNRRESFVSESLGDWPVGLRRHENRLEVWFSDSLLGTTDPEFKGSIKPYSPETEEGGVPQLR